MKRIINKLVTAVLLICTVCIGTLQVFAAGYNVQLNSSATKGQEVTVTVNFNTDVDMALLEGTLTYDSSVLEYVNGTNANANMITAGKIKIFADNVSGKQHKESFKFKALAVGSSSVLFDMVYYDINEIQYNISGNSATVTVKDPSTAASSNANLSSLKVSAGTLSPAFSKNVTSYNVTIPYDKEELLLSVTTEDANASCVVEGTKDMKVGANKRVIVVTAQNGAQKRYTINVIRLDEFGRAPESSAGSEQSGEKIAVTVGEQTLYIEENFESSLVPVGFKIGSYNYNDKEVPCITDDEIMMLYLTNAETSESAFYIVEEGNVFTKVTILTFGEASYCILPFDGRDLPSGYHEATITINEQQILAYQSDDTALAEFMLIYAKGPSGITGFYRYDTVEKTIQRAVGMGITFGEIVEEEQIPENFMEVIKNLNTNGIIVIVCIIAVVLLLLATIIVLIVKIATAGKKDIEKCEESEEEDFFDFSNITEQDNNKEE